jgi:hypothetical protein
MEENKQIELRSEKVRNIIGQVPPGLLRYGTAVIGLALCMLVAAAAFIPYQPKISIGIVAAQDEKGKVHYTALIPQGAMAQRDDIAFIAGHPPVEGPMPVRFIFQDVPDTLHVSPSGGWYEVEIYPIDTNAQAIKIPAPFTFPAKIEMRFTTFLEWVKGRR